jgi:sirohydrochlorin cobaltochelatase
MKKKNFMTFVAALLCSGMLMTACSDDDEPQGSTDNPVSKSVAAAKKHDTAILLCTFGSTFQESLKTYDVIEQEFKDAFPDADVYLAFSSNTCVNRVVASTGIARFQPKYYLEAIAEAGYERVAVQSLHVIPGEEYLDVMSQVVKKEFMIENHPEMPVLRSPNLLSTQDDTDAVAQALYSVYSSKLADARNIVLFMGHGNPEDSYRANDKYADSQEALQKLAAHKNVFVGTVDYGDMLFWPYEEVDGEEEAMEQPNATCIYAQLKAYCQAQGWWDDANDRVKEGETVTVYLAPFMTIAGDHAHNDLWGLEDEEEFTVADATPNNIETSWRLRLQHMGFTISQDESHSGTYTTCGIKGLGDYATVRQIWLNHLKARFSKSSAWETGEDYQ